MSSVRDSEVVHSSELMLNPKSETYVSRVDELLAGSDPYVTLRWPNMFQMSGGDAMAPSLTAHDPII